MSQEIAVGLLVLVVSALFSCRICSGNRGSKRLKYRGEVEVIDLHESLEGDKKTARAVDDGIRSGPRY